MVVFAEFRLYCFLFETFNLIAPLECHYLKRKTKLTMRRLLQTLLFTLLLSSASGITAVAHHGGDDDKIAVQQSNDDITIYPNPAIDYIMVTQSSKVDKVWIYNILGKKVKSYKVESPDTKYDIRDLPRGIYIVRLVNHDGDLLLTRRVNKINP